MCFSGILCPLHILSFFNGLPQSINNLMLFKYFFTQNEINPHQVLVELIHVPCDSPALNDFSVESADVFIGYSTTFKPALLNHEAKRIVLLSIYHIWHGIVFRASSLDANGLKLTTRF